MKTSETETILAVVFALSTLTSAVLTGYQNRDITEDRKFGCIWQGGSSNAGSVTCTCREDAEEMRIEENSIPSFDTSSIKIFDCKRVIFGPKSIQNMQNLRYIHLKNIQSLDFEESSLTWYGYRDTNQYEERFDSSIPSLEITVENCIINTISKYSFQGRIKTIFFTHVTVQNMEAFAFNSLMQSEKIILHDTEIKNVKLQSFKKFGTESVELDGLKVDVIPSRFMSNITVYKRFTIVNCNFGAIRPGGFVINNPEKFEVSNTGINQIDAEAFKVTTGGDVLFRNNTFGVINDGAFRGINPNTDAVFGDLTMTFERNVFKKITRDSLSVNPGLQAKFVNVKLEEECDCQGIERKIKDAAFYDEISCLHNGNFLTVKEFKLLNLCSVIRSYSTVIIIVGVVFVLCFIICTVLFIYYKRVYLSKKYGKEKDSKKGNMSLIVPDGRTYRETELHVIVERADLLTTDL